MDALKVMEEWSKTKEQTKGFANAIKGTNAVWMTWSIDDYSLRCP